jgi:hypothetical protein
MNVQQRRCKNLRTLKPNCIFGSGLRICKVKLKFALEQAISTLSLTSALDGSGWSTQSPDRFTPRKQAQNPLCGKLCGPQDRSE